MRVTKIRDSNKSPLISSEQFIAEHFFIYIVKGKMEAYDGNKHYELLAGECGIVRKNHLTRYSKQEQKNGFEKIVIHLNESFLKHFIERNQVPTSNFSTTDSFLAVNKNKLITAYIQSLHPYYNHEDKIDKSFLDLKQEELLRILLRLHPEYSSILFDFGKPGKIDLEAFMNKNYKFNVSIDRFAYLTGRSLSAFKRDFAEVFNTTPNRWLVKRRLQEAYFQIEKKKIKPVDIYLELGFENFSHFLSAFKKLFGLTPTELIEHKTKTSRK